MCRERGERQRDREEERVCAMPTYVYVVMCEPGAPEVRRRHLITGSWDYG